MSKNRIIIIVAGLLFLLMTSYQLGNYIYGKGKKEGYTIGSSMGYEKGNVDGRRKGYDEGFIKGSSRGAEETKLIFSTALKGASAVLADAKLEKLNPQLVLHKISKEKKEPLIRNTITQFTDSLNSIILDQLIDFGEFSTQEKDTIFSKYKRIENKLTEQAYQAYLDNLKKLNKNAKILDKAKALSASSGSVLCELIDLFSPLEKARISKNVLLAGNKRNREENSKESAINSLAKSYVSDQLCNLIITNSIEFILGGLVEYASIIQITKGEFVGKQTIEKVMKLVTAESQLTVGTNMTFERDWAFDPSFYVHAESAILAGIDLSRFYRVEFYPKGTVGNKKTEIVITVPKPDILSVYSKINPQNNRAFFATTLKDHEIDRIDDTVARISRKKALNAGILTDARQGAVDALNTLYTPLFLNASQDYSLKVRFADKLADEGDEVVLLKG